MQTQSGTDASGIEAGGALVGGAAAANGAETPVPPARSPAFTLFVRAARHTLAAIRLFLLSIEVLLWAVFFLVALAFLGLRYWVLPNVERYRPDIVSAVSAAIGRPVTVERISADWRGLRPQLEFEP